MRPSLRSGGRLDRLGRLLPGLWLGLLLTVALVATPAAFALLERPLAGRLVARVLAQEAYASLALGVVVLLLERLAARRAVEEGARRVAGGGRSSQFSTGMLLALGALFCTVAGYFAVQPMMDAARAGQGPLGFGALHAISSGFYGLKAGLVAALAWRATFRPAPSS